MTKFLQAETDIFNYLQSLKTYENKDHAHLIMQIERDITHIFRNIDSEA